jgi:hypothetical protein
VGQPTQFELIINLTTAKALSLTTRRLATDDAYHAGNLQRLALG